MKVVSRIVTSQVKHRLVKFFVFMQKTIFLEYDEEFFAKMPSNSTITYGKHAQFTCKPKIGTIKW